MPSFKRRASVLDADRTPAPAPEATREEPIDDALTLAEEAEAEAAEAEALAAAARARARALRLRREAAAADATKVNGAATAPEAAGATESDGDGDDDDGDDDGGVAGGEPAAAEPPETAGSSRAWTRKRPRLSWRPVAFGVAVLAICAALAASGYMIWQHRQAVAEQQRAAQYTAAARQAVVSLMSLDFNNAEEDVKRIIDNSTGQFKEEFEAQAEAFAQVAQESKVITEVTVNAAAVKEMDDDSALVLVSATSKISNSTGARQDPRSWRLAVDLSRDGDQIKMSKVEFVP